jgi:class 3 adenylate cyclase
MYDADFDIRMGLHYGEAVLGSLGSIGHERLTAVGDVFNVASRVETANKDAGTQLLISAALQEIVRDSVEVADFVRVRPRGTTEPNPPAVSSPEASPTPANRPCRNLVAAAGVREPLYGAFVVKTAF